MLRQIGPGSFLQLCWLCGSSLQQVYQRSLLLHKFVFAKCFYFSSLKSLTNEARQMVQSLVTTECSISFEIAQQGKVFKEQDVLEEDIIER